MRRLALSLAWVCLALSLVVHVTSVFGVSLWREFAFLHFGIFVLGVPVVFSARNRKAAGARTRGRFRALVERGPTWSAKALIFGYVYAALNFVAFLVVSGGGSTSVQDGKYMLRTLGGASRELTEVEYGWQQAHMARMISAAWALAYLFFVIWYWSPRAKATDVVGRPN